MLVGKLWLLRKWEGRKAEEEMGLLMGKYVGREVFGKRDRHKKWGPTPSDTWTRRPGQGSLLRLLANTGDNPVTLDFARCGERDASGTRGEPEC